MSRRPDLTDAELQARQAGSRRVTIAPRKPAKRLSPAELGFLVMCDRAEYLDLEQGRGTASDLRRWRNTKSEAALSVHRWLGGEANHVKVNRRRGR